MAEAYTVSDLGTLLRAGETRQLWISQEQFCALWSMCRAGANPPAAAGLLTVVRQNAQAGEPGEGALALDRAAGAAGYPGAFCRSSPNERLILAQSAEELNKTIGLLRAELAPKFKELGLLLCASTLEPCPEDGPETAQEGGTAQRLWPKLRDWISFISAVRGSYETVLTGDLAENSFRLTQASAERADEFAGCADYDALLLEMAQDLLPESREEYLRVFGRKNLMTQLRGGEKTCSMEHLQRCRGGALLPCVTRVVFPNSREPGESGFLLFARTEGGSVR
jgi:hypothetical protein